MSSYEERPWLARYDAGQPSSIEAEFGSALAMFGSCVRQDPDAPMIRYFDGVLTRRVLDEESGAFAAALAASGLEAGERGALYLQNVPQFLVALIGTWKAGGIVVAVNPMNSERELKLILADSGATVLVCLEDLYQNVARRVDRAAVRQVVTTSAREYQARDDGRVLGGVTRHRAEGPQDLATLIRQFRGRPLPDPGLGPLPGGALRTGDVGYMDSGGWFYLVDRKKDQINVSGYMVWPREVEDVLYEHEAVREAAVVGVPDPYRGETVKAFVSLKPGSGGPPDKLPDELIQHCRQRLEVLPELPKTVTGKILRRELRDQARSEPQPVQTNSTESQYG